MVEDSSKMAGRNNNLRNNRGRAQAYTQSGRQVGGSGTRAGITAGSASRSHGSKKRGSKTRSSLNVKSSLPLNSLGFGPVPSSLAVLPTTTLKGSKKAAAQIYGNSSVLNNLTQQRKKSLGFQQAKKNMKGKRSQPNQSGRKGPDQFK